MLKGLSQGRRVSLINEVHISGGGVGRAGGPSVVSSNASWVMVT